MTINILPDDALIYVFDFYLAESSKVEAWHTLVHVCRRWRILAFASPRRLNLRIACTDETSVKEKLNVWPALPIFISGECVTRTRHDNIKAALKHHDRVCQIRLDVPLPPDLAMVFAALEAPFPSLTDLKLKSTGTPDPILPNPVKFLGGSPHLRSLSLSAISVPGLPKLLFSFTDLVNLDLNGIPILDISSPDVMVTALSTLTRLETLHLDIASNPDWKSQPLLQPTRVVLLSLTSLRLNNGNEYSEDFLARIDAPLLDKFNSAFTCFDPDMFDTPQLVRFISRIPKFQTPEKAHIEIDIPYYDSLFKVSINFSWPEQTSTILRLGINWLPGEYIPRLVRFCHPQFIPLHTLKYLYIAGGHFLRQRHVDDIDNTRWLELLQPFTAVANLYLTKEFAPAIARALKTFAGETEIVLPTLENVFIEPESQPSGSVREAVEQFTAARQLSGHPIVIYHWDGRQGLEQSEDN